MTKAATNMTERYTQPYRYPSLAQSTQGEYTSNARRSNKASKFNGEWSNHQISALRPCRLPPAIGNPHAAQRYGDAVRRSSAPTAAAKSSTASHDVYSMQVVGSVGPPVSSMMKRMIQRSRQP